MARLIYGNVELQILKTHLLHAENVYDATGNDRLWTKYTIDVSGIVNPSATSYVTIPGNPQPVAAAGAPAFLTLANIRDTLSLPRQLLLYLDEAGSVMLQSPTFAPVPAAAFKPGGNIINNLVQPPVLLDCDCDGGPKPLKPPEVFAVQGVGKTVLARFAVSTTVNDSIFWVGQGGIHTPHTPLAPNGLFQPLPPVILSNRWSVEESLDEAAFSTRTYKGHAIFRADLLRDLITTFGPVDGPASVAVVQVAAEGGVYGGVPDVTFSPPDVAGGITATGTANMKPVAGGGGVASVTLTNPGSGYKAPPTVTFTGGGGSGASAFAVLGPAAPIPNASRLAVPDDFRRYWGGFYVPNGFQRRQVWVQQDPSGFAVDYQITDVQLPVTLIDNRAYKIEAVQILGMSAQGLEQSAIALGYALIDVASDIAGLLGGGTTKGGIAQFVAGNIHKSADLFIASMPKSVDRYVITAYGQPGSFRKALASLCYKVLFFYLTVNDNLASNTSVHLTSDLMGKWVQLTCDIARGPVNSFIQVQTAGGNVGRVIDLRGRVPLDDGIPGVTTSFPGKQPVFPRDGNTRGTALEALVAQSLMYPYQEAAGPPPDTQTLQGVFPP